MWQPMLIFHLFNVFLQLANANDSNQTEFRKRNAIKLDNYVYWPNGTVPFYIEENQFDSDQKKEIETTLNLMSQKTCLKFLPALTPPTPHQHVLVFTNPGGIRKCVLNTEGHPRDAPHRVTLGYSCLKSPHIEMVIMKALGFGFEHNRASRDLFISVQQENIGMAFVNLFTKDNKLPVELQALPYDFNSVLHFGERDYSKNGHRTIIIKDHKIKQNRVGLSPLDLRKIEIVYGPECRKRNRQEKIELCQTYPGIARKKRAVEPEHKSLRVNPDITPPPEVLNSNTVEVNNSLKLVLEELGIVNEVQEVVDQVYKVSSLAFKNARLKYCNGSKQSSRVSPGLEIEAKAKKNSDILGVIAMVANFAKSMVDNAAANLTTFCMESDTVDDYQRVRCDLFGSKQNNCPVQYKSTKSGPVKYSTQHRPLIRQSTKHYGRDKKYHYANIGYYRSRNDSQENVTDVAKDAVPLTTKVLRRKRAASFQIFRNKRHVQSDYNNKKGANVSLVEDINTAVNSSKENVKPMTILHPVDGRRQFQVHRYSVKHKDVRSAERDWDNSKLSTEGKDEIAISSDERQQRKEREYAEDVGGQDITNVKSYKDVRPLEDDKHVRPGTIQIRQHKNRWIDKDGEQKNNNVERPIKIYEEPDRDDMDVSSVGNRDVKKRLGRVDGKKNLKGKKYAINYREKRERENNENFSDDNRHMKKNFGERPGRENIDESLEETKESKKYKKIPSRLNKKGVRDVKHRDGPEKEKKKRNPKENRHIKKYTERPDSAIREESLEEKKEVNKYTDGSERENDHAERPNRYNDEESLEEKTDVNKYNKKPNRQKSVKHKDVRSAERDWDNSKLSTEGKDEIAISSDERQQRKEREYAEDVGGQDITNVKSYKDVRPLEDDKHVRPGTIQIRQHKNRWIDKDGEQKNNNVERPIKIYEEPDRDDMDVSSVGNRDVKKRLGRVDGKKNLKGKKYAINYREKRERENNEIFSDDNRHMKKNFGERPGRENIDESLEETKESKKYKKIPSRLNKKGVRDVKHRDGPEKEKKKRNPKENRHIKKYTERPDSAIREESLEEKKEVNKYTDGSERENDHAERPNRYNDEESLEEKTDVNKYNKKPNRQKRPKFPQGSSEDTRVEPRTVQLTKLNQEFYNERKWPGGIVPYYIKEDPHYDTEVVRRRLEEVNSILQQRTCVRLQELEERELSQHEDYMILDTSADFVTGRVGGKQNFGCLELFRGGQHRQHAAMVVMAMLGFYFELSRHDRDKYVRVHLRHVRPDKLHHFEKIREDATLLLPYDYKSATHPAWQFWRRLGRSGISSVATYKHLDPDGSVMKTLGQHEQLLSDLDIVKINSVYGTKCFRQKGDESD